MIKDDFVLHADDGELAKLLGNNSEQILSSDRNRQEFEQARRDFFTMAKPIVGWNRFPVKEFIHDRVMLENNTLIGGGPVVSVTAGAQELVLAICTVGPEIETRSRDYMKNGNMFMGYVLDSMASWGVDELRRMFCEEIKRHFQKTRGFRSSTMLSPGESDWEVKEQKVIFNLLQEEAEQIGVSLTESSLMIPMKSLSLLLGVGEKPLGVEGGSNCDFCSMRENCRYREMRSEQEEKNEQTI